MRFSTIACAGVFSVVSSLASASNNPGNTGQQQNPGTNPGPVYQPPACATGFNQSNLQGSPQSSTYGWECKTPVIVCPAAPTGMTGGLVNPAASASGKGEVFSYYCSWSVPPK